MNRHPTAFIENWVDDLSAEFYRAERMYERAVDRGAPRERALKQILSNFLPKKYAIASGHVISSAPAWSRQGDILIYNALEAPVFAVDDDFQGVVVPAESTYGIIEVKSTLDEKTFRDSAEKIAEFKRLCATVSTPRLANRFGAVFAYRTPTKSENKTRAYVEACIEIAGSFPENERVDEIFLLAADTADFAESTLVMLVPQESVDGPLAYMSIRNRRGNIKAFLLQLDARLRRVRTGTPPNMLSYLFAESEVLVENGPDARYQRANGELSVRPAIEEKVLPRIQNASCQMCGGREFASYDDTFALVATKDYYFGRLGAPYIPVIVLECSVCRALAILASNGLGITAG